MDKSVTYEAERFERAAAELGREAHMALSNLSMEQCAGVRELRVFDGSVTAVLPEGEISVRGAESVSVRECFLSLCKYSIYSCEDSIAHGFIPVKGGHRAGLCGSAVIENGEVRGMSDISGICLRIARERLNCANELLERITASGAVRGSLIVGAPCSGKTTMLRDAALGLASGRTGRKYKTVVIDERGELAAAYRGKASFELGECMVLDGYPKALGIMQAVRCLSPEVIICDEIGGEEEAAAVTQSLNAGAAVIASIHATDRDELFRRRQAAVMLQTEAFELAAILGGGRDIGRITDFVGIGKGGGAA